MRVRVTGQKWKLEGGAKVASRLVLQKRYRIVRKAVEPG